MSEYDYEKGRLRIAKILNNSMPIENKDYIPAGSNFTFDNGYMAFVTAIFVDIRDSTELFSNKNEQTAKVVRVFTSEIIEILKDDDNFMKEIGIRGDCVYAIYDTPKKRDVFKCTNKTFYINTLINMLNKMLRQKGIQEIKAGIGMATDRELIIKAGKSGSGINDKVWIGNAVTKASKLSSLGDKEGYPRLFYSKLSYDNFIDELVKNNPNTDTKSWFKTKSFGKSIGQAYYDNIVQADFSNWIKTW